MNKYLKYYLITLVVIVVDQMVKLSVHNYMQMGLPGEVKLVGNLFKLHYTLNPGMAFGIELGSVYGKLILSVFRIFAMGAIGYYLYIMIKRMSDPLFLVCIAMILGGAIGNVIDSTFYGVFLDNAPYNAPMPWFYGQVIDMFYIDIWEGYIPVPFVGPVYYAFWPIFNIADASIFISVCIILIFQKRFFEPTAQPQQDMHLQETS
ncbi:MAG: lipoprotein signal peptidase [Cytophagales bacterium]|nr:lipoprotein signal peptidase [Cytophagales bacterium]